MIFTGGEVVAVGIAAVYPVGHPYHVSVAVDSYSRHFDLAAFRTPRQIAFPLESVGVVDGNSDVVASAIFEFFYAAVDFSIPYIYVSEMVCYFGMLKWL